MKREVLIMAGTAATLATVMVGCSHQDKAASVGNAAVAPAGASNTKVLVDGKDQNVKGQVADHRRRYGQHRHRWWIRFVRRSHRHRRRVEAMPTRPS